MLQSRCSQCVLRTRQQSASHSRPPTHTSSRQLVVARMGSSSSSHRAGAHIEHEAANLQEHRVLEPCAFMASFGLYLLAEAPAALADEGSPFQGVTANSLYVTLGLFLLTAPGIWSQIKRAPTAVKKRVTFEVPGPAVAGAAALDSRARQVFSYFKRYNYQVKESGEVITFEGVYAPDRGQAAAVTLYTFAGMASIALVLSTVVPSVGNWWYLLTLLTPAAWFYYFQKGERVEQVRVKMVTADDEATTDIIVEGDREEITRLSKELELVEKGMVRVKGILEQ